MHGVLVGKGVNLLFHSPSCLFMVKITWQLSGKRSRAHSLYKDERFGTPQDPEIWKLEMNGELKHSELVCKMCHNMLPLFPLLLSKKPHDFGYARRKIYVCNS